MKKSFLALIASAALLASCGGGNTPSSQGGTSSEGGAEISIPEGKTALTLKIADGCVELPAWDAIYVTGSWCGDSWDTAADSENVATMRHVEGTDLYVGYINAVEDGTYDFQCTLGYTLDSGSPSTGIDWGYKSVECQENSGESGLENLQVTIVNQVGDLGSHHWLAAHSAVKTISNFKFHITFAEAVPSYISLFAPGSWKNTWACNPEADAMIPSEDRKTWTSQTLETALGGTFELKILAEYAGCTSFTWDHAVLDNGAGGNYVMTVKATWGDNYDLNILEQATLGEKTVSDFDFSVLPDPASAVGSFDIVVVNSNATPLDADVKVYIAGNFIDGWAATEMTLSPNGTYVYNAEGIVAGKKEFGIISDSSWTHKVYDQVNNANLSFELAANDELVVTVTADLTAAFTGEGANVNGVVTVA